LAPFWCLTAKLVIHKIALLALYCPLGLAAIAVAALKAAMTGMAPDRLQLTDDLCCRLAAGAAISDLG
jgi:hypothetical protein